MLFDTTSTKSVGVFTERLVTRAYTVRVLESTTRMLKLPLGSVAPEAMTLAFLLSMMFTSASRIGLCVSTPVKPV